MDSNEDKRAKNGVARLRERFYEIKRNIKIPPELIDALREKKPVEEKEKSDSDKD